MVSGWLVVGKWAEHAWVSGQPVSLSARTLVGPAASEDMDDDYPAALVDTVDTVDRLTDEMKPYSGIGGTKDSPN